MADPDPLDDPHLCADHLRAAIHAAGLYGAEAINVHQDLLAACVQHLDRLAVLEAGQLALEEPGRPIDVDSREL